MPDVLPRRITRALSVLSVLLTWAVFFRRKRRLRRRRAPSSTTPSSPLSSALGGPASLARRFERKCASSAASVADNETIGLCLNTLLSSVSSTSNFRCRVCEDTAASALLHSAKTASNSFACSLHIASKSAFVCAHTSSTLATDEISRRRPCSL